MSPLHDHQERAVEFMLSTPKCALWMQLGSGKTRAVIETMATLLDTVEVRRILIVAPLRVALSVWPDEIGRWSNGRVSHAVIRGRSGRPRERMDVVNRDRSDVHIINHDLLVWLLHTFSFELPYDMVILDESTVYKSVSSRRFQVLRQWLARGDVERVVQLTATPAPNSLMDLWAQMYLLDGGARLGKTKGAYEAKYFAPSWGGWRTSVKPRPGSSERIHSAVSDICFMTRIARAATVKAPMIRNTPVPLTGDADRQYSKLERSFVLSLDDAVVSAGTAAILTNKLRQAAAGGIYYEDGGWRDLHDLRLDRLRDIVTDAAGDPVAIAYGFRFDVQRIRRVLPEAEHLGHDPAQIRRWNDGEIPVMLFHPASAGHGLNLQHGGRRLVWYVLPWSLEHYQQTIGRFARQGQTRQVIVHRLYAPGTVDDAVIDALRGKDRAQSALLDYVAARRAEQDTDNAD